MGHLPRFALLEVTARRQGEELLRDVTLLRGRLRHGQQRIAEVDERYTRELVQLAVVRTNELDDRS